MEIKKVVMLCCLTFVTIAFLYNNYPVNSTGYIVGDCQTLERSEKGTLVGISVEQNGNSVCGTKTCSGVFNENGVDENGVVCGSPIPADKECSDIISENGYWADCVGAGGGTGTENVLINYVSFGVENAGVYTSETDKQSCPTVAYAVRNKKCVKISDVSGPRKIFKGSVAGFSGQNQNAILAHAGGSTGYWADCDKGVDDCNACSTGTDSWGQGISGDYLNTGTNWNQNRWAGSGESVAFGEYASQSQAGCCGDDLGEYAVKGSDGTTACCNNATDIVNGSVCSDTSAGGASSGGSGGSGTTTPITPPTPTATTNKDWCGGTDLNRDGVVNDSDSDLIKNGGCFEKNTAPCLFKYDFNNDCLVEVLDIGRILDSFTQGMTGCGGQIVNDYFTCETKTGLRIQPKTRIEVCGSLIYCDPTTLEYKDVKAKGATCVGDYECITNVCVDGKCLSIQEELAKQTSLLKKIWCKITNPFSEENYNACRIA